MIHILYVAMSAGSQPLPHGLSDSRPKDIGRIKVKFVESYELSGPYGAKLVGKIGIDTSPAAIANATGVRIKELPGILAKKPMVLQAWRSAVRRAMAPVGNR